MKTPIYTSDGNIILTNIDEILPFHVISTMSSANSTKNDRLIADLQFRQIIKAHPVNNGGLVGGISLPAIAEGIGDFSLELMMKEMQLVLLMLLKHGLLIISYS